MTFKEGDSVVVKQGIKDPDFGNDISGFQGRVVSLYLDNDPPSLLIAWDSETLKELSGKSFVYCEREGLDWASMGLATHEVELTKARDKLSDVEEAKAWVVTQYYWYGIGDNEAQGRRIQAVVNSADKSAKYRETAILEAWDEYLKTNLKLPFGVTVEESPKDSPIRLQDKVTVTAFYMIDESFGIIVEVKHKTGKYQLPLCDLSVPMRKAKNYQFVADYSLWFANR